MNSTQSEISIRRFTTKAIISPALSKTIGTNIQGPSSFHFFKACYEKRILPGQSHILTKSI